MGFRKILCPIDFSPSSREAMTVALRLATQHRSELVISFERHSGARGPDEIVHDLIEQARWGLRELADTMRDFGTSNVTPRLVDDQPWSKVVELASQDPEIDLIVFGSHDRTGLARVLRGSIVELVVRHAPCPVLVVPDDAIAQPFTRALCAVDLSPQSELAVELAVEVMQSPAELTLLHVIESPSFYGEAFVPLGDPSFDAPAEEALDRWRATLTIPTSSELRVGRAEAEILTAAESQPFDLVVVATHSRGGLRRMFLGSVAEAVVRQCHRPVLVARPRRRAGRSGARARVVVEARP